MSTTKNNTTHKSSEYILDSSREYALYVCQHRAIPSICDGLKDAQRKMLWLMRNKSEKIKVISLSGLAIAENLYLHGDASASGTISMLAAPYCNNVRYLDGIGQFGTKIAPVEGIGAPRYVYVRRNKAVQEILFKDLNIVPLKENYDGSTMEPIHFLPLIPTVLLNGVSGIAVGWSTDILPHNINDLIDACVNVLSGKKLKTISPSYDYLDCKVIPVTSGSWEFHGKFERINTSTIRITELPPELNLDKFISRLNKMEDDDIIRTYTDNSSDEINITIKFKAGILKDYSDEKIRNMFKLVTKKNERNVVIGWDSNSIKQYDDKNDIITEFVDWRLGWYTKRYEKMLSDDNYELLYWKALKTCFDKNLPNKLIKATNKQNIIDDIKKIVKNLCDDHCDKIASLPSYRWANDYYQVVLDKIAELENNILLYTEILNDDDKLKKVYIDELKELKKMKF